MSFPRLAGWEQTRDALHQAAQVLGAVKVAVSEPQPNELEYSLAVIPGGLGTGPQEGLGGGGLELDLARASVRFRRGGEERFVLPVARSSQVRLADALVAALAKEGVAVTPGREKIVHEAPFAVDAGHAAAWAEVVEVVHGVLSRFREGIAGGHRTPVVLWPHHFDLAFLRFVGFDADVHTDPQLSFGFAPESEGIPMPYLYWYGWPMPEGLLHQPAPGKTRWQTEGWTGLVLEWSRLVDAPDPAALLGETLEAIWDAVAPAFGV